MLWTKKLWERWWWRFSDFGVWLPICMHLWCTMAGNLGSITSTCTPGCLHCIYISFGSVATTNRLNMVFLRGRLSCVHHIITWMAVAASLGFVSLSLSLFLVPSLYSYSFNKHIIDIFYNSRWDIYSKIIELALDVATGSRLWNCFGRWKCKYMFNK